MTGHSPRSLILVAIVCAIAFPAPAQDPGSPLPDFPTTSSGSDSSVATEAASDESPDAPTLTAEEVVEEFKSFAKGEELEFGLKRVKAFEDSCAELTKTLIEMRMQHTRVVNGYSDDKESYLTLRDKSRALIQTTYRNALDLIVLMPHPDAARFIMTEVEARRNHDVYDVDTYEGAGKMMDIGVRMVYIAQATARSGMMNGKFEQAKRIYEKLTEEEIEDIDKALMGQFNQIEKQYEIEQELISKDPEDLPRVRFTTTRGDFVVELFINEAPSTAAHFIDLVESGFYDGCDFFQVIEGLLALTGDPLGDGSSTPDRFIMDEHDRSVIRMPLAGSLIMAKMPIPGTPEFVANSAGTQFAILYRPVPNVIDQQTVFGRVVEGRSVVGAFRRVDPNKEKKKGEIQLPPDRIIEAEVINRPEELPEVIYVPAPG